VQLSFATNPKTLSWLQHDLRTDERVVRWLLVKHDALPPMPKIKEIRRLEAELCVPAAGVAPPPRPALRSGSRAAAGAAGARAARAPPRHGRGRRAAAAARPHRRPGARCAACHLAATLTLRLTRLARCQCPAARAAAAHARGAGGAGGARRGRGAAAQEAVTAARSRSSCTHTHESPPHWCVARARPPPQSAPLRCG
jgi:hypothetical protein